VEAAVKLARHQSKNNVTAEIIQLTAFLIQLQKTNMCTKYYWVKQHMNAAMSSNKNKNYQMSCYGSSVPSRYKLECGPMPNMMAAQPNIGGAVCESSKFHSLYHAAKFG